ncbi:MFS transporter [Sinomonas mesophila]|uniref:MFS transporter n=1 Tax=Sinomonas mesophila TaxID=1531955 RepID=UPI0009851A14|nr:MFS transporter [Sinomonas mesophila]
MLFASFTPLTVARAWTGLMVGALYPTLLTLIGDSAKGVQRARSLSRLQVVGNLGTALATLTAGIVAALTDWRLVFGLTSAGCAVLLLVLRGKRETPRDTTERVMRHAFRPVVLGVYGLAVLEGMVLLGAFTYIVPALEHAGVAVPVAGLLGASYAAGIIGGAQVMPRLVERFCRTHLMTIGGGILFLGLVASAVSPSPVALTATAVLIGASTAILHVSVQGWATEVAPAARATTVSPSSPAPCSSAARWPRSSPPRWRTAASSASSSACRCRPPCSSQSPPPGATADGCPFMRSRPQGVDSATQAGSFVINID